MTGASGTLRRWLPPAAAAVGAAVLVAAVLGLHRPVASEGIPLSGPMPRIAGPDLRGTRTIAPADYRGRVVLVNFWASWCGPCREEQPVLQRLWEEYGERPVRFLGVDVRDGEVPARAFLREFGVTYPSVADPRGELMRRFGVPHLPSTVLVDASGEMRLLLTGAQTERSLRPWLDRLVGEAAGG